MFKAPFFAGLLASVISAHPTAEPRSLLHRQNTQPATNISSFKDVPRSSELKWVPCYNEYQCANLEVPLDYENPALGSTIVPWIRQVAVNGTGTDLLFNPGGPGGSGVQAILSGGGSQLMEFTGSKYNIVSFDPRGVNASDIHLTCYPEDPDSRELIPLDPNANKNELYAQATAVKTYCSAVNENTTARYAGTVAVVQDIMHFTELQASLNNAEKPEESLVWYLGGSYGTVIGQTLAALYPDRIGRVINMANVDSESHYNGLVRNAVSDADDAMRYFFQLCSEAGEKKCAFAGNSTSAQDLETRFDNLLSRLAYEPAQVVIPELGLQRIITRLAVVDTVHNWLYSPTSRFPVMAQALAGLDSGNGTAWLEITSESGSEEPGPFNYTAAAETTVLTFGNQAPGTKWVSRGLHIRLTLMYSPRYYKVTSIDAAGRYEIKNVSDYLAAVEYYESTSKWFGEKYAISNALINAGGSIIPPESQLFTGFKKTTTKNPILFVNTLRDPITPLESAEKMAGFFEGSGVLAQNSGGHSPLDTKSSCTYKHVQAYLETGKIPDAGTVCESDKKPLVDTLEKRDMSAIDWRH